jgi:hypothetical protein
VSEHISHVAGSGNATWLEPHDLLGPLAEQETMAGHPVSVRLWDNSHAIEWDLNTFLSKSYKVINGKVHLGSKSMALLELRFMVGVTGYCWDQDIHTDTVMG